MTTIESIQKLFNEQYQAAASAVDAAMESYLQSLTDVPERLTEAIVYSVRAGGKRLRPAMVIFSCQACQGTTDAALPAAAAIEMIHTFSLIHDDLPAMDDDDLRRGLPTNHKVFGEGMAILAGDALVTYAFETIARKVEDPAIVKSLICELAFGSGAAGMIGGQVADITHEHAEGSTELVDRIHTQKTAMLFRAACRMGAIIASAGQEKIDALGRYGLKLGLAFQIIDDLLDVTSTPEAMGKNTQKDTDAGKLTYPALVGLDESRLLADKYMTEAFAELELLGEAGERLRKLATMLSERKT